MRGRDYSKSKEDYKGKFSELFGPLLRSLSCPLLKISQTTSVNLPILVFSGGSVLILQLGAWLISLNSFFSLFQSWMTLANFILLLSGVLCLYLWLHMIRCMGSKNLCILLRQVTLMAFLSSFEGVRFGLAVSVVKL